MQRVLLAAAVAVAAACADRETLFGDSPAAAPSGVAAPAAARGFDADEQMKRAHAALDAKDLESAERIARDVVAHDGDGYPDAYVVLGEVQLTRHKPAEALSLFDKAIALDASDDWATVRAAEALGELGKHAEARDRLRAFVAAHPKTTEDVYDALGWAELDEHDTARAEQAFHRALEVTSEKDAEAFYGLALAAADRGDAKAAERALLACFALDPARRIAASTEEGLEAVRGAPGVRALFTKDRLDEARRAVVRDGGVDAP